MKKWFNKYDWSIVTDILAVIAFIAMSIGFGYLIYRWICWGTLF